MSKFSGLICAIILVGTACGPGNKSDGSVKFQQYYVEGEQLYLAHCSNCHQKTGEGLGLLYPPLNQSDFMNNNMDEVVCLIKYGRAGELIVNGKTYNQPMPGVPTLTDLEIAEITTYIYNTWSHDKGIVELPYVIRTLQNCNTSK